MRRPCGERGQAALEWLGIMLFVALVAGVLAGAAPQVGGTITRAVCESVATVAGGGDCGQEEQSEDRPTPRAPSATSTQPAPTSTPAPPASAVDPGQATPGATPEPDDEQETEPVRSGALGTTGARWEVFAPDDRGRATRARAIVTRAGVARRRADPGEGTPTVEVPGASGRCGTDRGHLVSRVLGGPGDEVLNFAAIPAKFNRGIMAAFEKRVAAAADSGYVLAMDTQVFYEGDSDVPSRVQVTVTTVSAPRGRPPFNAVFDEPVPVRVGTRPAGCDW